MDRIDPLCDTLDTRPLAQAMETARTSADKDAPISSATDTVEGAVIGLRRWFHAHPEPSLEETGTAAAIAAQLDALGIEYTMPFDNAVVATVPGGAGDAYGDDGAPRRRVLLRADIDALPVTEETGLAYASVSPGLMHGCGHDCHVAMLLGAAAVLQANRHLLHGEVRLVFQPAEENARGARMLVEAGVCDGVDGAYACHVWSGLPSGKVSAEPGPRMANADWWRAEVTGASTHGALPHLGADAALAAAAAVVQLQAVVSRQVSPLEPAVVTVGRMGAGTARNVVAQDAWLEGTVRTYDPELRRRMPELLERTIAETARAHGCEGRIVEYLWGSPAVINDGALARLAAKAAVEELGPDALVGFRGSMGGEDFSEYQQKVPGVFVFLGCAKPGDAPAPPQHSCHYDPNESALRNGVALASRFAVNYLAEGASKA